MTEFEQNILNRIEQLIHEGKLSNDFMVQNIELMCEYTGLNTLTRVAKDNNISYQGVLKSNKFKKFNLFGVNLATDNF